MVVDGLNTMRRLCATESMSPVVEAELLPGPEGQSDEDLLHAACDMILADV